MSRNGCVCVVVVLVEERERGRRLLIWRTTSIDTLCTGPASGIKQCSDSSVMPEKLTADRTGSGSALGPASRIMLTVKRRRGRVLVFVLVLASVLYGIVAVASQSGKTDVGSTSTKTGPADSVGGPESIIGKLFDIEGMNTYFNSIKEKSEKAEKLYEDKAVQISHQVNLKEEALLNDAEQLKKLYLDKSHDGLVNYGSTGNMAKAELNVLQNKESDEALEVLDKDEKARAGSKGSGYYENIMIDQINLDNQVGNRNHEEKDRSIPLSDSDIPNEEAFAKIKTEDFIKGDITFQSFFSHILKLISNNHLSFPLKRRMVLENGKPVIDNVLFFEDPNDRLSEKDLYEKFDFPQNFIDDLKLKHKRVVEGIPNISPHFYKGDGYVMVGGGIYSWYALLGIEMLRKVGSTLPVEIFLPHPSDYEYQFCDKILPKLNAKCVEMYRIFSSESLKGFDVQGYQYKGFALLASSFENAFLLDSDSYAVSNPDVLFKSELYDQYQMVTWPDFWRRTTSPHFYEIRGTRVGMNPVRHLNDVFVNTKYLNYKQGDDITTAVPYHDRAGTLTDWTTESGEMLINKRKHFRSLILALYYNYDGPYGYYPLLSQGGAGEGDKETFVAAANYYGLPYYQVNKRPEKFFGWFNDVPNWEHSTIVQYNPLEDFELLKKTRQTLRQDMEEQGDEFKYDYNKYFTDVFTGNALDPMFYHVHDPKMDPFKIMEKKWTENLEGKKIRNIGEDFPRNKFDMELFLWGTINHYICETKVNFKTFEGKDVGSLCNDFMPSQLEYLKKSSVKIYDAFSSDNLYDQMHGGRDWN